MIFLFLCYSNYLWTNSKERARAKMKRKWHNNMAQHICVVIFVRSFVRSLLLHSLNIFAMLMSSIAWFCCCCCCCCFCHLHATQHKLVVKFKQYTHIKLLLHVRWIVESNQLACSQFASRQRVLFTITPHTHTYISHFSHSARFFHSSHTCTSFCCCCFCCCCCVVWQPTEEEKNTKNERR